MNEDAAFRQMTTEELIAIERYLWTWMDYTEHKTYTAKLLNSIHREVERRKKENL
jgi:hypothetical protein